MTPNYGRTDSIITGVGLGACVGAGLMYLLDPQAGRRRRARLAAKFMVAGQNLREAMDVTWRDTGNRIQGLLAELRTLGRSQDVGDWVLVERVRAQLGTLVRHPRSVHVQAQNGRVTLGGVILADEKNQLLDAVVSVPGVASVEDRLKEYKNAGDIPGLQGDPPRPRRGAQPEWMQRNWAPAMRMVSGVTGGLLGAYAVRQRGPLAVAMGLMGLGLLARGLMNIEFRALIGFKSGHRVIDFHKTINIAAPVEQVFDFWTNYDTFPQFMSHVEEVRATGEGRSHWVLNGPAGTPIEWDAVITQLIPNEVIAWKTEPNSIVQHAGIIRFTGHSDKSTTVNITMSYNPPAGAVGHGVAALLGSDPKTLMDEDLARMKTMIETGKAPHDAAQRSWTHEKARNLAAEVDRTKTAEGV